MNTELHSPSESENEIAISHSRWSWYPWIGLLAGIGVLGQLYLQSSQTQATYLFERFWLGMFLFYIPTFWRILSPRIQRSERLVLLVGLALFSYVPKLFRCPYYFCYSDELTWWRGVQNLLGGSPVLSNNPLGLIQGLFPGLPLLTIVLQKAGGLPTFQVGLVLMGVLRVLTLLSLFLLGEKIFNSSRVGAAAAVVYMMNANFLFFSSQYSYESLSIPLLLVILVFLQDILKVNDRRTGIAWSFVILMSIAAIVITHHLATYMLVAILAIMTVFGSLLPRFTQLKSGGRLGYFTLFSIAAGVGWLLFTSANVVDYFGDPISRGIRQLASQSIRRLFSGITLPWYEITSGYLSAVLIVLLSAFGAFLILRQKKVLFAEQMGLLSFGLMYLGTAPLVLTSWGAESGRRSWIYSFIGLALLSGVALAALVGSGSLSHRRSREIWGRIATTSLLAILLLGGVASSTSISYRFPGEYLQNSDARSYTPEYIDAAQWIFHQAGPDNRVLGDRTTERVFGSYGLQQPAMYGGPRPWEVYLPTSWTSDALHWLEDAEAPFVVVDKRMAELSPQMAIRFQDGEPVIDYSDRPMPAASVEKFDELARLDRIYDSGNIRIYFLNDTGRSIYQLGRSTEYSPLQNPMGTDFVAGSLTSLLLVPLIDFFRSIFLVVIFLIICGSVMGSMLFPGWSKMDMGIRITAAISISISSIILLTFILALVLSSVEKASVIVLILLGLIVITGAIRFLVHAIKNQSGNVNFLAYIRNFSTKVRLQDSSWVYAFGILSVVLLVFTMGKIKPRYEPHTVMALVFSSATPGVRITNHETGKETYQLVIYGDNTNAWSSQPIELNKDQSIEVSLQQASLPLPSGGVLNLDLFIEGHEIPYRSLHFLADELPGNSSGGGGE